MTNPRRPWPGVKQIGQLLSAYAAYHRSPGNRALHAVGVPMIVWSLMVLLRLPGSIAFGGVEVTLAHVVSTAVLVYYLRVDLAFGVVAAVAFTFLLVTALEVGRPLLWGGGAFVVGWSLQLLGHGVFENRRPALVDNVSQALVAPLFIIAEASFALNLRQELKEEVQAAPARAIGS